MFNITYFLGHFLECPFFYSQQNVTQLIFVFIIANFAGVRLPKKYIIIGVTAFFAAFISLLQYILMRADFDILLNDLTWLFPRDVTLNFFGIYSHKNLLAAFLLIGFFVLIQWFDDSKQPWFIRFIPLVFMASVILLTDSRAALLGLTFGCLATVYPMRNDSRFFNITLLLFIIILSGWGVSHLYGISNSFTEFSEKTFQGSSGIWSRSIYWCAAILVGFDNFWFGTGLGGMKEVYGNYLPKAAEILHLPTAEYSQTIWPHNDFLHIFAEFGFPVFLAFCCFCFYLIYVAYRKKYYAIAGAFTSFYIMMFFSHPFRLPMLVSTFLILALYVLKEEIQYFWCNLKLRWAYILLVFAFGLWLIPQASSMLKLNNLIKAYSKGNIESASSFNEWAEYVRLDDLNYNKVGAWRFQHSYYTYLAHDILYEHFDREYAKAVLPYALQYSKYNNFYTMDYVISRLYYVLGDYEAAMEYSWSAFDKKPDKTVYYSFYHLCHVLYKCKQTDTSIITALGLERVTEFLDSGLIDASQFDDNWRVL